MHHSKGQLEVDTCFESQAFIWTVPKWSFVTSISLPTSTRTVIQHQNAKLLLHHYCQMVSSKLPWIDSVDNPWRVVIVPAALQSPFLLFTILSMAAEDLTRCFGNDHIPIDFPRLADNYRESAIKNLADHLSGSGSNEDNIKTSQSEKMISALAATLLRKCCIGQIEIWRDELISKWQSLQQIGAFSQNLLWPLFISGTEMHNEIKLQQTLENDMSRIVKLSGHWNGIGALTFLKRLWAENPDGKVNWIDFAIEFAREGNELLII